MTVGFQILTTSDGSRVHFRKDLETVISSIQGDDLQFRWKLRGRLIVFPYKFVPLTMQIVILRCVFSLCHLFWDLWSNITLNSPYFLLKRVRICMLQRKNNKNRSKKSPASVARVKLYSEFNCGELMPSRLNTLKYVQSANPQILHMACNERYITGKPVWSEWLKPLDKHLFTILQSYHS